jgi:voltage-gated potassium channel Kch
MELGVHYIIRETFLSSLDLAQHALESLGLSRADALESIKRFRSVDERTLNEQLAFKDDEQRLIQNAQQVGRELDRLFEADAAQSS